MIYLKPINIPKNTIIQITKKNIIIQGPKGVISHILLPYYKINFEYQKLFIIISKLNKQTKSIFGLFRTLLLNNIYGVTFGYSKTLLMEGIGYKFSLMEEINNNKFNLILNIGFTHTISISIPKELSIELESPTKLTIFSIYKQKLGTFISRIRNFCKPEPYKGKGIRFEFEYIKLKKGKRA